VLLEKP